ncbi:hypothetical protein RUM44_003314 [Polyplax serrata]|uniref:Uncharacterized protein n=1 Tax=Polyplax serrata TaxID=468196 RepID=A0ABR1AHP5_POLSC
MFFDLNIPKPDASVQEVLQGIVERGVKYGYRAFAITTNVDEIVFTQQKMVKNKKKSEASHETTIIPSPVNLNKLKTDYPKVHFYNRINLKVSDNTNIRKFIQQKELKIYDLISFEPQTQDALKSLTSVPAMDILSYNPENRIGGIIVFPQIKEDDDGDGEDEDEDEDGSMVILKEEF